MIVVGGGVYGIALTLEASRRGLKTLLLERSDFGSETSWNSLRIVHGGLRYLQSLDLRRFFESVSERRWFLRHFPDLVHPLPCLMPLYGQGLKRPSVFRAALATNAILSATRNRGVEPEGYLPAGKVLSSAETLERFPLAPREGLRGAALWYDAAMPDSQRLLLEMLHWACNCGASAINYMKATAYEEDRKGISRVTAIDRQSGEETTFLAALVINAAGPWCRDVASTFDRDAPELFQYSVAVNVVLDRPPLAHAGVAISPRSRAGRTYFLVPWKGRIMAGTYHAPWTEERERTPVSEEMLEDFLGDLGDSIPGFAPGLSDVHRVHWGLLPATSEGTDEIATRPVILHHADQGGPEGLFSVSGVKFTTARLVAEKTLGQIQKSRGYSLAEPTGTPRPAPISWPSAEDVLGARGEQVDALRGRLEELVALESVLTAEDVLRRRTDWYTDPLAAALADRLTSLLPSLQATAEP
jgi:glycerol-3-phosphate dehydrogenase